MPRKQDIEQTRRGASAELERSCPVFERARRLASALFGSELRNAAIVLLNTSGASQATTPPGAGWVAQQRELLWVEDTSRHPLFMHFCSAFGEPLVRAYVAAPIRLDDGSVPGVLAVGGPEPRPFDRELADRLQDLADLVADEWTRVRVTRARDAAFGTLEAVLQAAPLSLAVTDRELRLIHASPTWLEERALTRDQAVGQSIYAVLPELFEPWRRQIARCLEGRTLVADKAAVPRPDGSTSWVQARVAPWRDAGGSVGGLVMVSHDLSQMVEAMDSMARSEERLKLAVEIANLYVWEMDLVRRELNKVGRERDFFSAPQSFEAVLADPFANVDPRDRPAVEAQYDKLMSEGAPFLMEHRMTGIEDREMWVASTCSVIRGEGGDPVRVVGAVQDVTKRKMQERALIQARDEAEAANRAKSAFLATISHEIRTPLNGLLGMAQAMEAGPLDAVQRDRLAVIRQSGEGLLAILNEVLDLSKIEAGKLSLEDGEFDLEELARGAYATFQAIAENKGLAFELKVLPAAKGRYRGDPMRVRQIIYNLVSNALKFTDRGSVAILVGRRGGRLRVHVRDTGIGMTREQRRNLFQAFEQAEASTTRRYGGTGLGLAICRELAELMSGRIGVRTAPGQGATFIVHLPLPKVGDETAVRGRDAQGSTSQPATEERAIRVLAAEDNSVNQLVLKTLLNQVGVEPVMVDDGRAVVEAWAREPWDLILMDVQMPLLDGPAATAEIRARETAEGRRRTPIVALTANAMDDQIAQYQAAGMDGFVAKPIAASRLFAAIETALRTLAEPGSEAAA